MLLTYKRWYLMWTGTLRAKGSRGTRPHDPPSDITSSAQGASGSVSIIWYSPILRMISKVFHNQKHKKLMRYRDCQHWQCNNDGYGSVTAPPHKFETPVHPSKVTIRRVLLTYWLIQTQTMYICPSELPSWLISVTIQRNHCSKQQGWPNMHLAQTCSKNSSAHDVINGILEWTNQRAFSCHMTRTSVVVGCFCGGTVRFWYFLKRSYEFNIQWSPYTALSPFIRWHTIHII